jgi:hypothetical protein
LFAGVFAAVIPNGDWFVIPGFGDGGWWERADVGGCSFAVIDLYVLVSEFEGWFVAVFDTSEGDEELVFLLIFIRFYLHPIIPNEQSAVIVGEFEFWEILFLDRHLLVFEEILGGIRKLYLFFCLVLYDYCLVVPSCDQVALWAYSL